MITFSMVLSPGSSMDSISPKRHTQGVGLSSGLVFAASTLLADTSHHIEPWNVNDEFSVQGVGLRVEGWQYGRS